MVHYDNEFFRGPPEESPTLAADQRPTGVEIFQAKPEKATAVADVPVTREEVPKDPPKKKNNARRITKAIKLLASCVAAVVITEAAVNIAATIEPPAEVPTGAYYAGQWPGVSASHNSAYVREMDADMGYSIQIPLEGKVWRLTADQDWRMCWYEGTNSGLDMAFFGLFNLENDVFIMADLTAEPHYTEYEGNCYTTMTTSTGETLYVRAFFNSFGQYGEEYGLDDSMLAESAELRQALVDEVFAEIEVTPGTADGWQGFQIGDHLYSQQGPEWYGLGGFGDLEIHIPWVNYAADYGLHDKTPYARETVNGITWSIYFAENDTYLWAVPNIDPEICLGGLTARFMCADAVRRGEYINDEEWLEMGGFTSASQRQTAVDILIECLQHHYALDSVPVAKPETEPDEGWYIPDWPEIGQITADHSYHLMSYSKYGTYAQFSLGDASYRMDSANPSLCFFWNETGEVNGVMQADIHINHMTNNRRDWRVELLVQSNPFTEARDEEIEIDATVSVSDGSYLYLRFRRTWYDGNTEPAYDVFSGWVQTVMDAITASPAIPNGWGQVWICDLMTTPLSENWDGNAMVTEDYEIPYFNRAEEQGLWDLQPYSVWEYNDISWTFIYEEEDDIIWALPDFDLRPDVQWCIGAPARDMAAFASVVDVDTLDVGEYRAAAVEGLAEGLSKYYPRQNIQEGVWYTRSMSNPMQISLGHRGYKLVSHMENAWMTWYSTDERGGVMVADLNLGTDFSAGVLISEEPLEMYDNQGHGQIPVDNGGTLYWYTMESFDGDDAQLAEFMGSITASEAIPEEWGRLLIEESIYSQQGLYWSGWGTVNPNGGRPVMIWNLERTANLALGDSIARREINGILWTLYITPEYSSNNWPFIWAVPDVDPTLAVGSDYENVVYKYYEDNGTVDGFDGDIWSAESQSGAAEVIFEVLHNYYPQ